MKSKLVGLITLLTALLVAPTCVYAIPIISIQPPTPTVTAGQTFSLDVDIAAVADLYAFQFDIGFDPALLSAVSISEGPFLPSGGATIFFPGTIDNFAGTIAFNADSLVGAIPGVTGNGTLLTIDFVALAAGISSIDISNEVFLDSSFNAIAVDNAGATITIPAPSTLALFAAILPLGTWIRRQKY